MLFAILNFTSCGSDSVQEENYYSFADSDSIYETAEDGSVDNWSVFAGHPIENIKIGANGSNRSIFVRENWLRNEDGSYATNEYGFPINDAHYELSIDNNYQFILEFDKMKKEAKTMHCFTLGVKLETEYGERHILFDPFYDKEGMEANTQWIMDGSVKELIFPLSMDYVNIGNVWKHLRLDLNDYLHQFEPDNNINTITAFYFQGGDDYLDNIRLVSE